MTSRLVRVMKLDLLGKKSGPTSSPWQQFAIRILSRTAGQCTLHNLQYYTLQTREQGFCNYNCTNFAAQYSCRNQVNKISRVDLLCRTTTRFHQSTTHSILSLSLSHTHISACLSRLDTVPSHQTLHFSSVFPPERSYSLSSFQDQCVVMYWNMFIFACLDQFQTHSSKILRRNFLPDS